MQENIGNVIVDFPYQPYDLQKDYMRCVINSCENGNFALLESPTGTGKTLSLLCSVLSWKRQNASKIQEKQVISSDNTSNDIQQNHQQYNHIENQNTSTKIIYSSRTHSQLSNVINELKKTVFHPTVSQIASRSRLCLIEEVIKHGDSTSQSQKCRILRQEKKCEFSDDEKINTACDNLLEPLFDIEDFATTCKTMQACPYFVSQKLAERSDLILMPYTYFVDPNVRTNLPATLFHNSVIIVDEAHNFPEQCCDYFSFSVKISIFQEVSNFLTKICQPESFENFRGHSNFELGPLETASKHLNNLYQSFTEILNRLLSKSTQNKYIRNKADYWYQVFENSGITSSNVRPLLGLLTSFTESSASLGVADITPFDLLTKFIRTLFPYDQKNSKFIDDNYSICLTSEGILNIFCFSPSIAFSYIIDLHPKTVILTSGTISPFDTFISSLGYEFPIVLQNPHIANMKNLFVAIATHGSMNSVFHFTYQNRTNQKMKNDFAHSLSELMKITPFGFLSFFPSFSFLNEIESLLKSSNQSNKKIIIEPRDQRFLKSSLNEFERNCITQNGAALFAVCRGKMSEGLDFSDDFARCVTVVGIPFPNLGDVKVETHKLWLDEKKRGEGSKWYVEKAMRAVNQAIGRAIRHKDDYAAVVLFDQRYEGFKEMISKWIQPSIKTFHSWSHIESNLKYFFNFHRQRKENSNKNNVINEGHVRFIINENEIANNIKKNFKTNALNDLKLKSSFNDKEIKDKNKELINNNKFIDINSDFAENSRSVAGERKFLDDDSEDFLSSSESLNPSQTKESNKKCENQKVSDSSSEQNSLEIKENHSKSVKNSSSSSSSSLSPHQRPQSNDNESDFQLSQPIPPSTQNDSIINDHELNIDKESQKKLTNENNEPSQNDPYEFFTRSQRNRIVPKISKSKIAAISLKSVLEKDERKLLCDVLRLFKQTRNVEILKIGIDALESEDCKKILVQAMSSKLKEEFCSPT
ncbi:hypothetical protein M9Y10_044309 [Tritrichomonas musculus]|uniref:Helicase ATP-binding domain-containing protein n=1 Tax=Tritrichomonas musculus TaxID=1915356 RepID=A0ABR2K230_9EUKA